MLSKVEEELQKEGVVRITSYCQDQGFDLSGFEDHLYPGTSPETMLILKALSEIPVPFELIQRLVAFANNAIFHQVSFHSGFEERFDFIHGRCITSHAIIVFSLETPLKIFNRRLQENSCLFVIQFRCDFEQVIVYMLSNVQVEGRVSDRILPLERMEDCILHKGKFLW